MALIQCGECNGVVSDRATACPHCGNPQSPAPQQFGLPLEPVTPPDPPRPVAPPPGPLRTDPPTPSTIATAPAAPVARWRTDQPAPWSRFAARFFDNLLHGALAMLALVVVVGLVATPERAQEILGSQWFTNQFQANIAMVVMIVPINALLVGLTGTTLGKWLFGIRVATPDGAPIGMGRAFEREFVVLAQGLGLGIPFVSAVTQFLSYQYLRKHGRSAWDAPERSVVRYRNHTAATRVRAGLGIVLLVVGFLALTIAAQAR